MGSSSIGGRALDPTTAGTEQQGPVTVLGCLGAWSLAFKKRVSSLLALCQIHGWWERC